MDSTDLSKQQIEQIAAVVRRQLRYLYALRTRMEKRGFRGDDELYLATCRAFNTLQGLGVTLHYLSCDGGVGRPPRKT
jgi:hypothetical protein